MLFWVPTGAKLRPGYSQAVRGVTPGSAGGGEERQGRKGNQCGQARRA